MSQSQTTPEKNKCQHIKKYEYYVTEKGWGWECVVCGETGYDDFNIEL